MTPASAGTGDALRYALVTAARNEEALIGRTLASVVAQTRRPERWVVVSDGSTDGTDDIVKRCAAAHDWIRLLRMPERRDRHFGAKATAFNAGCAALTGVGYDIVGNLDADISFEPDYFAYLLDRFAADPELGVAGTPFVEDGKTYDFAFASTEHVSGGCQLFRRACFEQIGGYTPIRGGAIDWMAVTTARMKGWRTRTFLDKVYRHHRTMGTAGGSALGAFYRQGRKDYTVGGHPAWEALRGVYQMKRRPYVAGGLWLLAGYVGAALRRVERVASPELRTFHRKEQLTRLKRLLGIGRGT